MSTNSLKDRITEINEQLSALENDLSNHDKIILVDEVSKLITELNHDLHDYVTQMKVLEQDLGDRQ